MITSYVKDGWVFVATKVRRDKPDNETSTPHPLSFTFKTDKPVYPMQLTGVDNGPLNVELYVFGPSRAEASHFSVERCTRPNYPEPSVEWARRLPETPNIVHPLLRKWVNGSPVATKLTAMLSRADMRKDVWINWTPFWEKGNRLFSRQAAQTIALNWGTGLFAVGLLAVCLLAFASKTHKTKLPRRIGIVMVASIVLLGLFYLTLPKTEVRLVKGQYHDMWQLWSLKREWDDRGWRTIAEARAGLRELISDPENAMRYGCDNWDNYFFGGQVREEDSPGNYTFREANGQLEFISYDAEGTEHVETIGE